MRYNSTSDVNPLVAATDSELTSDTDNDSLTLLEEAITKNNPETTDNPMSINTTTSTTSTTDSMFLLVKLMRRILLLFLLY